MNVTRFAPSPTGYLHLGHAYAALHAFAAAGEKGRFLLRIEDIDPTRCKPEFTAAIFEDLHWLGLNWPEPVRIQSKHLADYQTALARLKDMGLLYPCFCTRSEVAAEAAASGEAPHAGPDGIVYPGTCRHLSHAEVQALSVAKPPPVWRLNMTKACAITGPLTWNDFKQGETAAHPEDFGDVVLARRDVPTSYHLSVTVDDNLQNVTLVTRGEDLLRATDVHRLLQALLGYQAPQYHHHKLETDGNGRRYSKRNNAVTLRALRASGKTPVEIRAMVGF